MTVDWTHPADIIRVVDGDTLEVDLDLGFRVHLRAKVRVAGIDTPERGEPGFAEASRRVRELVRDGGCRVTTLSEDQYGRWVSTVRLGDGRDLGGVLVGEGLAVRWDGHGPKPARTPEPETDKPAVMVRPV